MVLPSSNAHPPGVAIAILGVIVVLVVAILVVTTHVIVKQQYPGCCTIEPQVVGNCIAIPWMKIGRNVGTRRRSNNALAAVVSGRLAPPPPV